jgi:hypothetical protein
MRWICHALRAEADIVVDPQPTVVQEHTLAVAAEHTLIHAVHRPPAAAMHTDRTTHNDDPHAAWPTTRDDVRTEYGQGHNTLIRLAPDTGPGYRRPHRAPWARPITIT